MMRIMAEMRRHRRRRKAKIPPELRERVKARSGGICVRPGCGGRIAQLHHVLDEHGFPELALTEWNLVGVCWQCQQDHHFKPYGRLPRSALPPQTLRRLRAVPRYRDYLLRFYPDKGPPPTDSGRSKGGPRGRRITPAW